MRTHSPKKSKVDKMDFEKAQQEVLAFRDARDWEQFHTPKDLALSITLEAAELLEVFQWSGTDLICEEKHRQAQEELADVIIYCIYMAKALNVDIGQIIHNKIVVNETKYPVGKAKGRSEKYTHL